MTTTWERLCVGLGALAGLTAVAMAAVASHALAPRLNPTELAALHSAVEMQGWHALALLFCALWIARGGILARAAACCFAGGLVLFCTGVYASALTATHLGIVAPLGGTILMLGWALLAASALIRHPL
jgi:uncharacterized membrane protein YgdD (TMEM256/DUF423 family)